MQARLPARAGAGFKLAHAARIREERPALGWFELHPESYMVAGGPRHAILEALRADYPLSFHGVGLSLGGAERLDRAHLAALGALAARYDPAQVSEHLAWSAHAGVYFADLLPLPYDEASLARLCDNVDELQEALGRRVLIENPAHYLTLSGGAMAETDFLVATARRTGCGLLVDANNVYVSAANVGLDAEAYLDAIPGELIEEIHLAGHVRDPSDDRLLIDNHGAAVAGPVWRLFERLIARVGPKPALVEWDSDLPAWPALLAECLKAEARLAAAPAVAPRAPEVAAQ